MELWVERSVGGAQHGSLRLTGSFTVDELKEHLGQRSDAEGGR